MQTEQNQEFFENAKPTFTQYCRKLADLLSGKYVRLKRHYQECGDRRDREALEYVSEQAKELYGEDW